MKKWLPFGLIILMAIAILLIKNANRNSETSSGKSKEGTSTDPASTVNRNHGFDRRTSFIEYTKHAKCRMECRKISDEEVKEIMQNGTINYRKSNVKAKPCPSYAVEGRTRDHQRVRIVFGQCDLKTKVITVIDLDTDWECSCPGDDTKYQNRN